MLPRPRIRSSGILRPCKGEGRGEGKEKRGEGEKEGEKEGGKRDREGESQSSGEIYFDKLEILCPVCINSASRGDQ